MTQNDYRIIKEEYGASITELNDALNKLDEKYIQQNKEFDVGDKIKITCKPYKGYSDGMFPESIRYAFIEKMKMDHYLNEIVYTVLKAKKDGLPSKQHDYIYESDILEKVN